MHFKLFCFFVLLAFFHTSVADTVKKHQQQLQHIDTQISNTQSTLSSTTKKRDQLQQDLQNAETAIGQLSKTIDGYGEQLLPLNKQLQDMQAQETQLTARLKIQRDALAAQLRSAYLHHQINYLKVLFNQQNAAQVNRMMTYYQYYNQARLTLIHDVNETLEQLQQVERLIRARTTTIEQLRKQRIAQQQTLHTTEQQRKQVITRLSDTIMNKQQQLTQLQRDKRDLETLITRLTSAAILEGNQAFKQLKGKLPWPIKGIIKRSFNSKDNPQSLPLQGVLLAGNRDQMIQSIAQGKVIYADWLRGFGLLLIIDHGEGYMTLYAHCKSLFKKVGESVTPGMPIATIGNSGGLDENALLFQIRYKGTPQDPKRWCR